MAKEAPVSNPLATLQEALERELGAVGATVEHTYSSSNRGSLTVYKDGQVMQTSYFSSWELDDLRNGGANAIEKQKQAILSQIDRLLNPPKPQPINLSSVAPLKRGRGAKKPAEAAETTETAEPAESSEAEAAPAEEASEEE